MLNIKMVVLMYLKVEFLCMSRSPSQKHASSWVGHGNLPLGKNECVHGALQQTAI